MSLPEVHLKLNAQNDAEQVELNLLFDQMYEKIKEAYDAAKKYHEEKGLAEEHHLDDEQVLKLEEMANFVEFLTIS